MGLRHLVWMCPTWISSIWYSCIPKCVSRCAWNKSTYVYACVCGCVHKYDLSKSRCVCGCVHECVSYKPTFLDVWYIYIPTCMSTCVYVWCLDPRYVYGYVYGCILRMCRMSIHVFGREYLWPYVCKCNLLTGSDKLNSTNCYVAAVNMQFAAPIRAQWYVLCIHTWRSL